MEDDRPDDTDGIPSEAASEADTAKQFVPDWTRELSVSKRENELYHLAAQAEDLDVVQWARQTLTAAALESQRLVRHRRGRGDEDQE